MGFFERIGRGWNLALASFDIIKKNKCLLVFSVFSIASLVLVMGSFIIGLFVMAGSGSSIHLSKYLLLFMFYFINSTVIIFFNMALIHCTFKILSGGQASIGEGISFSFSRLPLVLSWALVSTTVGLVLRIIEDKHEIVTKIVTGLFGMLWSLATFLVIPVMAYENLGVFEAVKRSAVLFKSTWGERVGASFSFGIIGFILFIAVGIFLGFLIIPFSFVAFIIFLIFAGSIISCIMSAGQTVFLAAVYQYSAGIPVEGFDKTEFGNLFIPKG